MEFSPLCCNESEDDDYIDIEKLTPPKKSDSLNLQVKSKGGGSNIATHPELRDLYENLQELQIILWELLMKILKQKIIIETEVEDFHDDFDDEINNEVFSNVEIEKFKKIYNNEPIEESEINELKAENEKLKEKKEQAKNYIINIFKKSCCNKNCLEEIDQEVAILWFQNYINLTKDQQNMFLLRIISTSTSEYLTMAYVFDGVAICSSAFFKLYDLSKNRLIGLKNHYKDNDIVPKVHLSKGKKTHPELRDLYENLQELQNNFMGASYEDIESENIIETAVEDFHDDFDDEINNEVFSNVEIEKFKKIYNNEPIEESEINELKAENEKLKEKKEQAKNYIINIFKKSCCNKNCLEEIDQEVAILWFQNYINLTKDQQNMFLLRIISTSTSEYLTMAYVFDGVAICSSAFFKLYDLSKNRLIGLKNHYKDNDIVPKVHLSKGKKVSHNKFSFETILKVLTFLKNYANLNGLPSPESGPKATEIEITTEPNQTININKRKKGKNTNYNNMLQKSIHNNKSKNKRLKHFNEKETHEEKINSSEDETRMNLTTHKGRTGEDPFWGTSNPNSKNQLSNISKNSNNQLISKIYQDNQENQTDTNKNSEDTNIDNTISSEITDDLMSDNETIEDNTSSMDTNQEKQIKI
ncbi:572_t:CDS:2 [Entrophospora sp. SA101]|nr:572_t:CDS:2 [Entrophospora sp. SA101]